VQHLNRMPARPSKEDVLTAYRQSVFLPAAIRVFGEYGFERATMERIAREADVAKGTIYLYYKSKQAMYDAALRSGLAALDERTRLRIEEVPTLRDAIVSFIATRAEYFAEHPDFFRMYVAAVATQIVSVGGRAADVQAMVEQQTGGLERAVERAVARREIRRVDSAATALAIFDLTRGLLARRLTTRADPDLTRDAVFLADLIWRGLWREPAGSDGAAKRRGRESRTQRSKRRK
jgi:AcrR family transcriptional regulator